MGLGPRGGWLRAEVSFPCEERASQMETLCGNNTLGCKKGVELRGVAFCMVCPAIENVSRSRSNTIITFPSMPYQRELTLLQFSATLWTNAGNSDLQRVGYPSVMQRPIQDV